MFRGVRRSSSRALTVFAKKKVNIYLGPLPGPWKRDSEVKGPEVQASLAS
jgi:hypothetical protein